LAVTFDGSHSLPGARWAMKFGDGSANASGTGAPPASIPHSYAHPGSYFATLTVYNEIGDTDSASAIISVSKAPTALAAPAGTVHTVSHTISVSATLTRTDTNTPLAGKLLFFGTGTTLVCAATTNASGVGACTGSVSPAVALNAPSAGYVVAFGGDGDTNAVSANGKLTSVANARDVAGARARSALHGTLRASSIHALRGTSPAGTQAVSVSLVRVNGSGCAQLDAHGRLVHATRVRSLCLPGLMIPAAGTRHWHLSLTGTLKRGQYRLYVWTVDADGVLRVNTQSLKLT
jgi:PKD repeat protein